MPKKKLNFEQSLNRLEKIVEEIENSEINLEKSIELYKEGVDLSSYCIKSLGDSEKEINILTKNLQGEFEKEIFENN